MVTSRIRELIALLTLASAAMLPASSVAQQLTAPATAKATSINMEDVSYPYPVQYIDLTLYGNDVRMVYMDVQPTAKPNGRTVVLLH